MASAHQRIVMLIGASDKTRGRLASKLGNIGWQIIGGPSSELPEAKAALIQSIQSGQEIVIDKHNKNESDRQKWFHYALKELDNSFKLQWIGLIMSDSAEERMQEGELGWKPAKRKSKKKHASYLPTAGLDFHRIINFKNMIPDPVSFLGPSPPQTIDTHSPRHPTKNTASLDAFDFETGMEKRAMTRGDIILLFDLNGTLTSHTSKRRTTGHNKLRPGIKHLLKLKDRFRLGIFTSSTYPTVTKVLGMFAAALEEHIFDSDLILFRDHTAPVTKKVARRYGLRPWDTVKPLETMFSHLSRVVLFDDDPWKAIPSEQQNMVIVPSWVNEDPKDNVIEHLVGHILRTFSGLRGDVDLRLKTGQLTKALQESGSISEERSNVVTINRKLDPSSTSTEKKGQREQVKQNGKNSDETP